MFPDSVYIARRKGLQERLGEGLVILPGNAESPMNYADNCYPFRQDSTFLYFVGLDQPDLAAVLDLDEDREILFGKELTIDDIVWTGLLPTIAERAASVGIGDTRPLNQLEPMIAKARNAGRPIHFLPPYRGETTILMAEILGTPPSEIAGLASLPLTQAVVDMRSVKSPEEIRLIEEAVDVAVDMHTAAMRMARPGIRESEIAAEVVRVAEAAGGGSAFPVIATVRGEVLHNHDHSGILESGDLFLLDAGAMEPRGYCSDLSSTFPVDMEFTPPQKEIYQLSLAAHQAAVDTLGPGIANRDVHFAAARVIVQGMQELGLMQGDVDEALLQGAHAMFFPCGVGHMLGLDVHDMENLGEDHVGYRGRPRSTQFGLKSLRLARPLEPGFCLTVEPGIYFIPQLIDRWRGEGRFTDFLVYDELEKWRDFGGIRNEEDYLITDSGKRRLGKRKPMTEEEIKQARS